MAGSPQVVRPNHPIMQVREYLLSWRNHRLHPGEIFLEIFEHGNWTIVEKVKRTRKTGRTLVRLPVRLGAGIAFNP